MQAEQNISIDYSSDLKSHADLLSDFFGTLFDPKDSVLIVAGLDEDRYKAFSEDIDSLPDIIAGKETQYYNKKEGHILPRRFLDPFSRTPGSTRIKNLASLHELNKFGYSIYFAINPMLGRKRCQKAVKMARHILIESDTDEIDDQLGLLGKFGSNIISAVHSGGKSIHSLIRISPTRWNPHRVEGWKALAMLGNGETRALWPEYREMANYWIAVAGMHGVKIDEGVARDYSRVSRVPGFLHPGTGRMSTIIRINQEASWKWHSAMAIWNAGSEEKLPEDTEYSAYLSNKESEVSQADRDYLTGDDRLFPWLSPFGRERSPCWEKGQSDCCDTWSEESPKAGLENHREDLEVCDTSVSNVVRRTTKPSNSKSIKTRFLDAVEVFQILQKYGLPGRHERRNMHRVLFETARMFRWDKEQMTTEWKRVIEKNPAATIETPETAVSDMLRAWHVDSTIRIHLPDLTKLPSIGKERMEVVESRLGSMGCQEALKGSKILVKVILPLIKEIPGQCISGSVSICSKKLRDASNVRGLSRDYKNLWSWMQKQDIVTCTNTYYTPAGPSPRTRKYKINIPLVIWLCGFQTNELVWEL